jgi:hypothetical protein
VIRGRNYSAIEEMKTFKLADPHQRPASSLLDRNVRPTALQHLAYT